MSTPSLHGAINNLFWPPADELLARAEQIRAQLGDWPAAEIDSVSKPETISTSGNVGHNNSTGPDWRFCLTPPPPASAAIAPATSTVRDVIVVAARTQGATPHDTYIAGLLHTGVAVIDISGENAVLYHDGRRYDLAGAGAHRHAGSDDWLAAWAAFLDCGFALHDGLCLALAWCAQSADSTDTTAQKATVTDGTFHDLPDWPHLLKYFPEPLAQDGNPLPKRDAAFPVCPDALGLYPVVPDASWVERLVPLGVRTLQLRVKSTDQAYLREQIVRAVAAARSAPEEVRLFINDHWELAIEAGAYGVHLGQEDLLCADFDRIAASGLRLGLSTHGYYEILLALRLRPSYIACGAVFPTTTKTMPTAPQGLSRLREYIRLLDGVVPTVAIGGIDQNALSRVLACGARSAAVVRAVTLAQDLPKSVSALLSAFNA